MCPAPMGGLQTGLLAQPAACPHDADEPLSEDTIGLCVESSRIIEVSFPTMT